MTVNQNALRRPIASWLWLLLSWGFAFQAHSAELRASVDRQALTIDEHVVFTLTLSNSDTRLRAQGTNPNVDLSVLTGDFHVGSPRDSHRYNLYRGQGRSTSELTVELFPKRAGTLSVPAFHVDGLSTTPLTLSVHAPPPGAAPLAFARASVNKSELWQREQLVASLDVYSRVDLESAQLGGELITEPRPLDEFEYRRLPVHTRSEQHAGFAYHVMRTAWALFPTEAGGGGLGLQFPEVWIVAKDGTKLRLPGEQLRVAVKSLPADIASDILVGDVQLALAPTRRGEVTHDLYAWELTLRTNALSTAVPSGLEIRPVPGLQLYVDRPLRTTEETPTGLLQSVRYTLTAIPLEAGSYRLPDVQMPYFDPESGKAQVANAAGPAFEVGVSSAAPSPPLASSAADAQSKQHSGNWAGALPWIITAAGLFILWLATLVLWLRQHSIKRRSGHPTPDKRRGNPTRPLEAELLDAFGAPSLAAGLTQFEARHGVNEALRLTVQRVQRLYYGPAGDAPCAELRDTVHHAAHMLRTVRNATPAPTNPWLPESFTPAEPVHQTR